MTVTMNPTMTIELDEDQTVTATEAWTTVELSGGKAYMVNRLPGGERLSLAPGVRHTDGDRLDAVARSRGRRLVSFDPYGRTAILAALPTETERVRDQIAHALNSRPWEVDISLVVDDGGDARTVVVWRSPSVPREKRKDRWLSIAADFYAHDDDSLWRWSQQWIAGANRTVLTYSADPLAEVMPYPADASVSLKSIPFGIAEDGTEVRYALYEGSHLMGGSPGGGKSGGVTSFLCGASRLEHLALVGVDLKIVELKIWSDRMSGVATDLETADDYLARIASEMMRRYEYLGKTGGKKIVPSEDMPLIGLVVDELAELVGSQLPELKEIEGRINSNLRRILQLGRAAGVWVLACTQKAGTEIIKSSTRDLLKSRICFSTSTPEMTDTILGTAATQRGAASHLIANNRRGVAFGMTETSKQPTRMRAYWVPDEDVTAWVEQSRHLRVDLSWLTEDVDADEIAAAGDELDKLIE